MGGRVLLVEDDEAIRFGVARHLERNGFVVAEAVSCETARERFRAFDPHAVVTDYRLPDGEALPLISDFRRQKPSVPILVLTGYGTIDLAVRAVKRGASNLLTKPVDMDRLVAELRAACPAVRPTSGVHERVPSFGLSSTLLGSQPELEQLKDLDCSLLILGETGTGKTLLARWLHNVSRRREMPFVDLNCAGLARDLVESELFGHERGAFTSAHAAKRGMFDLADGGTLFLDEIGDVDAAVQPKLLKAIEEKRFRPLGGGRERSVDVRVVAATHCNLREAARANRFRSDLYYRLSTVTVTLPSLRQRHAEIPLSHMTSWPLCPRRSVGIRPTSRPTRKPRSLRMAGRATFESSRTCLSGPSTSREAMCSSPTTSSSTTPCRATGRRRRSGIFSESTSSALSRSTAASAKPRGASEFREVPCI